MAAGGAVFLAAYGAHALRRAAVARGDGRGLDPAHAAGASPGSLRAALATAAGFTFLNPHVWLDTVVLAGSVGARLAPDARVAFVAGGASASVAWFSALGWGAGRLAPVFRSPQAWRVLDAGIGATMLALAAALASQAVRGPPA
jgi:L-lysine exporter family protein LysE/ArgO